ncbi:hypothetical protein E2C01_036505 [Portunus trituberculatus]|uniref:Secreted protein n=1 Tax=Portunus trituberculatus TaxID=210409 RepID=A0A5B7FEC3_PORTR|nr:hypothetical protein [Portunus trituberculatus]
MVATTTTTAAASLLLFSVSISCSPFHMFSAFLVRASSPSSCCRCCLCSSSSPAASAAHTVSTSAYEREEWVEARRSKAVAEEVQGAE